MKIFTIGLNSNYFLNTKALLRRQCFLENFTSLISFTAQLLNMMQHSSNAEHFEALNSVVL